MPIYEYTCDDCQERVELFFRSFADLETKHVVCPQCQGSNLERLVSRVSVIGPAGAGKAAGSHSNQAAQTGIDPGDSKTLAQTMRRAAQSAGQDMGSDFKEVARRLERGEAANSIEKSLRKRVGEPTQPH